MKVSIKSIRRSMKKLFLSIVVFCFSFLANCQLDSVSVTYQFNAIPVNENAAPNFQKLFVNVWVSDFDFFGEVIIDVVDAQTNYPLTKVKITHDDVVNLNLISNGQFSIEIGNFNTENHLIIKANVSNYQFLDLPQIILNYPAN